MTMGVHDTPAGPVLTHKVVRGVAQRSFGLQVARLAGVPEPVVGRAEEVLALLQRRDAPLVDDA